MNQALGEKFYRELFRIRRVEEEIARIYPSDKIQSPVHLSIGQEAIAVGVCQALDPGDVVFGTYRSHALYLAKGGNLKAMMAELYGKVTGSAKGKGGSMHLADPEAGVLGTSAVVGTSIPQAVGYAYALKLQGRPNVVASFFGDGAVDEGVFHESMNFAALKRVPVIFVCENNFYAIHSRQGDRQPIQNITERARTYGMSAERIEEDDVCAIHDKVKQARQAIVENGSGPMFFECHTYRWKEHVGPGDDFDKGYRTMDEAKKWMERDQIQVVGARLDPEVRASIESEIEAEIVEAFRFAEASPAPGPEELLSDVFKET